MKIKRNPKNGDLLWLFSMEMLAPVDCVSAKGCCVPEEAPGVSGEETQQDARFL